MQTLTLRHAQQLSAALAPFYDQPAAAPLFDRLAAALQSLFGAETVCFDFFDAHLRAQFLGAWPQHLFSAAQWQAASPFLAQHPLCERLLRRRCTDPLRLTDLAAVGQFTRTDLYDCLYRFAQLTHQLVVSCPVPGGGLLVCALFRTRRDFTEADRTLLAFVQPHLRELVRRSGLGEGFAPLGAAAGLPCWASLGLTMRETDVLHHLVQGRTDKEIGQLCGISWRTVQIHLRHIYEKLGVRNRTAAVQQAFKTDLLRCLP